MVKLVPVAPERAGALDFIRTVVSMGAPLTAVVKAAAVNPAWASASDITPSSLS